MSDLTARQNDLQRAQEALERLLPRCRAELPWCDATAIRMALEVVRRLQEQEKTE